MEEHQDIIVSVSYTHLDVYKRQLYVYAIYELYIIMLKSNLKETVSIKI